MQQEKVPQKYDLPNDGEIDKLFSDDLKPPTIEKIWAACFIRVSLVSHVAKRTPLGGSSHLVSG